MKKYLRLNKRQIIAITIVAILYFLFVAVGFKMQLADKLIDIKFTKVSFLYLAKRNGLALVKLIILGVFSMCIYDLVALFMNGLNFGVGLASIYQHNNISVFFSGVLPHGIFEIPSIILGATIPLMFFITFIRVYNTSRKADVKVFIKQLKGECFNLLVGSFILVIVAAIIESAFSRF